MKIIDPHLHFWDLSKGNYYWLQSANPPFWSNKSRLQQNFLPSFFTRQNEIELAGFVHIEAGFDNQHPWREIKWLEAIQPNCPFRTVAGIDLCLAEQEFDIQLKKICQFSSVVGVRHILDENAVRLLQDPLVQTNLAKIAKAKLIFEAQFFVTDPLATEAFIQIMEQLPNLKIALNHAGFIPADRFALTCWQQNMEKLAKFEHLHVKISGMEMFEKIIDLCQLEIILKFLIETFGISRLMLASNFPVCLLDTDHQTRWKIYRSLTLSEDQWIRISFKNASDFYQISPILTHHKKR